MRSKSNKMFVFNPADGNFFLLMAVHKWCKDFGREGFKRLCDDSTKVLALKGVTMGERVSKIKIKVAWRHLWMISKYLDKNKSKVKNILILTWFDWLQNGLANFEPSTDVATMFKLHFGEQRIFHSGDNFINILWATSGHVNYLPIKYFTFIEI